ncbi:MAG: MerR family transcriptional regulator [Caulobacteraceae bacterium]
MAKSPEAFRTISEAAEEIGVPQHVLRFWETKFSFIRPMKRAGGRRFYRPQDVRVLGTVRRLLHDEGYTIKGVQKLYKEQGLKRLAEPEGGISLADALPEDDVFAPSAQRGLSDDARARLSAALDAAEDAKAKLDALLKRK